MEFSRQTITKSSFRIVMSIIQKRTSEIVYLLFWIMSILTPTYKTILWTSEARLVKLYLFQNWLYIQTSYSTKGTIYIVIDRTLALSETQPNSTFGHSLSETKPNHRTELNLKILHKFFEIPLKYIKYLHFPSSYLNMKEKL